MERRIARLPNEPRKSKFNQLNVKPRLCSGVLLAHQYNASMKHGGKMLICLIGGLALRIAANEVTTESSNNPYQSIVDRNVFALKPPPPPPDPEATKPPPVKITLTVSLRFWGSGPCSRVRPLRASLGNRQNRNCRTFLLPDNGRGISR